MRKRRKASQKILARSKKQNSFLSSSLTTTTLKRPEMTNCLNLFRKQRRTGQNSTKTRSRSHLRTNTQGWQGEMPRCTRHGSLANSSLSNVDQPFSTPACQTQTLQETSTSTLVRTSGSTACTKQEWIACSSST